MDGLVERVARAIVKLIPVFRDFPKEIKRKALTAAITECEKAFAEKIERLERERAVLEAQAAAMREALSFIRNNWAGHSPACDGGLDDKCDCDWPVVRDKCDAALSTDAGEKVLAVVEQMKKLIEAVDSGNLQMNSPEIGGHDDIPPHPWHEEWMHLTRQALAEK